MVVLDEFSQSVAVYLKFFGNLRLGLMRTQALQNDFFLAGQFMLVILGSLGTPELFAFSLETGKGFRRALGNEFAFDFGGQTKGKCQHLAL